MEYTEIKITYTIKISSKAIRIHSDNLITFIVLD